MSKKVMAVVAVVALVAILGICLVACNAESIQKKLETQRKLSELDELRRTVEVLPPEILQEAKKVIAHKPQER